MNHSYFHFDSSVDIYLSIITSMILLLGNYMCGKYFVSKTMEGMFNNNEFRFFHYPLLGNLIMNACIQIGIASQLPISKVTVGIGICTLIMGVYGFLTLIKKVKHHKRHFPRFSQKLGSIHVVILLIIGFFFLALAPITNADALDYHVGVPIWMLQHDKIIWQPTWFHQGMAGIGENSILMSLMFHAEQFATLVQFGGLFSIIGLFFSFSPLKKNIDTFNRTFFIILLLSTPVILFLGSTPKPQLTGIALTSIVFCFLIHRKLSFNQLTLKNTIAIVLILTYAVLIKLNFVFAAMILILAMLIDGLKKRQTIKSALVFVIVGIIISIVFLVAPYLIIKSSGWGKDFLHYFHPLPSSYPGFKNFIQYLSSYQDNPYSFPFNIILPKTLGQASMVLGANAIILIGLFFLSRYNNKHLLIPIFMLCACLFFFSQRSARFFFEPMVWLTLYFHTSIYSISKYKQSLWVLTKILGLGQLCILTFALVTLSKGILNIKFRKEVLANSTNGYALSEWVNKNLPTESNILLSHRSTALFRQNVYKAEWLKYIGNNKNEKLFYENYLSKQRIDYVILTGTDPKQSPLFPYCDKLFAGPFEFNRETRNPANKTLPLKAWIYSSNLH